MLFRSGFPVLGFKGRFDEIRIAYNYAGIAVQVTGGDTSWDNITIEDNESSNYVFYATGSTGTMTMQHCTITGNAATYQVLYTWNIYADISNCLVYDNTSTGYLANLNGSTSIYNTVFYNNKVTSSYNLMYVGSGSKISSSIFMGNTSVRDLVSIYSGTLNYSDFYSNTIPSGYTSYTTGGSATTASLITSNPQFTDAAGHDFSLSSYSPCKNTGDSSSLYNDTDGTRNDMGAYGGPAGGW